MTNGQPPPPMAVNLSDAHKPYTNRGTSTAARLTVALDLTEIAGRGIVEVWVQSNAAAIFIVEAALAGAPANFREFDRIVLPAAGSDHVCYVNAYPVVRVRVEEHNNSVIEIAATR